MTLAVKVALNPNTTNQPAKNIQHNLNYNLLIIDDHPMCCNYSFNPLPHIPILGSSNSAANKYTNKYTCMMSKIWTNGVQLSD